MASKRKTEKAEPKSVLEQAFEERGPTAIATVRRLDPLAYVKAVASVVRDLDG